MPSAPERLYDPIFDDERVPVLRPIVPVPAAPSALADRADPKTYRFTPEIRLAINLALATGRPLLVSGPSGMGKSSLAAAVAAKTGWSLVHLAITSRTLAQDLLYELDHLRRLRDAQAQQDVGQMRRYLRPGPLFWAFAPDRAAALCRESGQPPHASFRGPSTRWVVLLDEVDKADPDVPNNLLVPLGQLAFDVPDIGRIEVMRDRAPLVVLTTNGERDLPPAFLRRCVHLDIPAADAATLVEVGQRHGLADVRPGLGPLADAYMAAAEKAAGAPNAAEFLDFVRAWRELQVGPASRKEPALQDELLSAIVGRGPVKA